jgi:hypothetical protein
MRWLRYLIAVLFGLASDLSQFLRLAFQSRTALVAENLFLRKQLAFYCEHKVRPRLLTDAARLSLVFWSRLFDLKKALVIVKPDTLIGWHRKGFKLFWRWKSRPGRPALSLEIRELIARMARENPTWGQARVAAELSVPRHHSKRTADGAHPDTISAVKARRLSRHWSRIPMYFVARTRWGRTPTPLHVQRG